MAATVAAAPSCSSSSSSVEGLKAGILCESSKKVPYALSTFHRQQQHLAFLRADEASLHSKAKAEVEKFDLHVELLKTFFLQYVDELSFVNSARAGGGGGLGNNSNNNVSSSHGAYKYRNLLQAVRDELRDDLPIYLDDVREYFTTQHGGQQNEDTAAGVGGGGMGEGKEKKRVISVYEALLTNTSRYIELLYQAADQVLSQEAEMFAAAAATSAAAAAGGDPTQQQHLGLDEEEMLLLQAQQQQDTSTSSQQVQQQQLKARLRKRDPWRRIRERDMAARHVPAHLRCGFRIYIYPPAKENCRLFRSVDASSMGLFSFFRCEVLRVQQTKPKLLVAAYECEDCHEKVFQPVEESAFTPLATCPLCKNSRNREGTLRLHPKLSSFLPFQQIRVQEPTQQIPEADVPRTLSCHLLGHAVCNLLQPGMRVTLGGVLKPQRRMLGVAASYMQRSGGAANIYQEKIFEVSYIHVEKQEETSSTTIDPLECMYTAERVAKLRAAITRSGSHAAAAAAGGGGEEEMNGAVGSGGGLYDILARSIAPGVWGLEDVKKALLLQLIGGKTKRKGDGGLIRGELHILLMGDPGLAKSQLMKQVCTIAPRAIYTTGKGSSSCGLTAAVLKDPHTQETTLEGGALVLADRGVCCIDEFDKMDDYDRSAIYEVMEQQSVSIAKAGHCSSLPARTAVLAAANPKDGRYDVRKPMMVNMNLPAALLSRFDLQFLLLDQADRERDEQMAAHILQLYRNPGDHRRQHGSSNSSSSSNATDGGKQQQQQAGGRKKKNSKKQQQQQQQQQQQTEEDDIATTGLVSKKVLRAFIQEARKIDPVLPDSLIAQVAEWYSATRYEEQQQERLCGILPSYTTPRALLGVLRLSQALARLRFSETIEAADFEEALRLMEASKESVRAAEEGRRSRRRVDKVAQAFELIKALRTRMQQRKGNKWNGWMRLATLQQQAAAAGLSNEQLETALHQYEELALLTVDRRRGMLAFVEEAGPQEDEEEEEEMQ